MVFVSGMKQVHPLLVFLIYSLFSSFLLSAARKIISKGQPLKDGEFLTSDDEVFEIGFFSTVNSSTSRYLGIRYRNIEDEAIIWIANRNSPISDTNGSMIISEDGNLIVRDGNGKRVWSSNVSKIVSNNTVAVLKSTGNFVLSNNGSIGDTNAAYWQSFKDPTDTFLPYMSVSFASSKGETRVLTSWKSETDPSAGNFTMGIDPCGEPQIVIWEQSRKIWRSGHWNGLMFTGIPNTTSFGYYLYALKDGNKDDGQTFLTYRPSNPHGLLRFQISWNGYGEQLRWNESENKWVVIQKQPASACENYNYCGNFGMCSDSNSPRCSCIHGFEPSNPDEWKRGNWSGGSVRRTLLRCQRMRESETEEDGFNLHRSMKLPDNAEVTMTAFSLEDCKKSCLQNCSCTAFSFVTQIGCMLWKGELIDVQHFEKSGFNDLYIRLANSEFGGGGGLSTHMIVITVIACRTFVILSGCLLWKLKRVLKVLPTTPSVPWIRESEGPLSDMNEGIEYSTDRSGPADLSIVSSQVNAPDLPMFNFKTVAAATDNFSEENKLGQGGFGHVYKGKLPGGEEIAVKRLSKVSGQGLEEFKNELILIAKLQHRNLVRLLGCCIQGEEKILFYEYMPNKSLDCFIFDPAMQSLLDWRKRFMIIEGIARGLLYLHRDSRLRIIHRDLKASNILLDDEMKPKISDFGMAKIFGGNQSEANTNRVVGTFGYMSPEYAMGGLFSVKSDVYSFGVLVLEIVSGRRNITFRLSDHLSLIAYSWKLWNEGRTMELVDPSIESSCSKEEVLKCIQVGILCVQDSTLHRPTMQAVVSMLESNSSTLPVLKQPTFTLVKTCMDSEIHANGPQMVSSNNLTVTEVVGR